MNPYLLSALAAGVAVNNAWGRRSPKPPPPGRFAAVADRRIHYVERPGDGPPVLLLHGMPGTHLDFAGVMAALPHRHTVAVDRPGYGWSEGGPLDYPAQIDLVPELLAALGIERALLAGHSFGGLLALGVAARHPHVAAGLALIAPSGGGLRSGPIRMGAARMVPGDAGPRHPATRRGHPRRTRTPGRRGDRHGLRLRPRPGGSRVRRAA